MKQSVFEVFKTAVPATVTIITNFTGKKLAGVLTQTTYSASFNIKKSELNVEWKQLHFVLISKNLQ